MANHNKLYISENVGYNMKIKAFTGTDQYDYM